MAPHLAPHPFPLLCLPPASFPLTFLLTSGNETQPLGPPFTLTHYHPQTPRPQEMETLLQAPHLLPKPHPQPGLPLLLLLATTSPGRSHAEPMGLASPSGLWRVRMDRRNTWGCVQSQNSTESNLTLLNPGRMMAATLRLLREGKKVG